MLLPMQRVDNYEYELPSDFEDEEIDEGLAFTEEDKKKYAGWFGDDDEEDAGEGGEYGDDEALGTDDFEDDDEEGGGRAFLNSDGGSGDDEEEEDGDDDEDHADLDDDERYQDMMAAVLGRKGKDAGKAKQRVVQGSGPESEFNLTSGGRRERPGRSFKRKSTLGAV